jgi:CHAT domain-containing protein
LRRSRESERSDCGGQRSYGALVLGISFLIFTCGLACRPRNSPQESFDRDYQDFLHGDLTRSQEEAHRDGERFRGSSPDWAWKFEILEAQSLLSRGLYEPALKLLASGRARPTDSGLVMEILSIEVVAHADLHQFPEAANKLAQAEQMCAAATEGSCGKVMRAHGVLAVQRGQIDIAQQYFEQSLMFARGHGDRFLEETAFVNLGLTSASEGHFDEALDWTNAAYQAATALGARTGAEKALGNLGWAYYNLGDSERSLELSLEAERRATEAGNPGDAASWTTNVGYVYASQGELARAKQSYRKALDLASENKSTEGVYNALRALALVSVEGEESQEEARDYADRAIKSARDDKNRSHELYPLMVKGMIASHAHDAKEAERVFREVEHDSKSDARLKWRAEEGLARLYEDEKRTKDADREYRSALATFEEARASLQRSDSRLPFSNNAARIYDNYIHFLVQQEKTDDALRWADNSRARTLLEGLGLLSKGTAKGAHAGPPPLQPREIARQAKGVLLFYWLGEKQSYLWAITPREVHLFPLPPGAEIDAMVQRYRSALNGPQDVLQSSEDARALYRTLVEPAKSLLGNDARVFIIPDGRLNNLNFETLVVTEPKPHFWIEDADVVNTSSLRVLAASFAHRSGFEAGKDTHASARNAVARDHEGARRLLLIGDSVAPSPEYRELPRAAEQMANVAKHFSATNEQVLTRAAATPAAYLASNPAQFSHIHFVAHGTASQLSPLDSAIVLSKGLNETDSFKLYARDIVQHRLRADLVTISACYGAGERAYYGEGLVGLAWAFLGAGAHNVIAGLWEVTDASTEQLMDRFYNELDKGARPDEALRAAKLSLLRGDKFHNPFYWAPFQLYTGS